MDANKGRTASELGEERGVLFCKPTPNRKEFLLVFSSPTCAPDFVNPHSEVREVRSVTRKLAPDGGIL